ncbi:twin-arginine translocase TatA/TatE family subunit [Candidatus Ishikawella capsulata]|uniref:Sec-independent protein translocase protein TatA n=1 Tax=Candidatus Ishikawaella capsulata Mpkobe TaxID=476281 RepID=C5WDQ1_9ENTR|nr:twin-arginine translocase TatA/TatE family subunit [Candidatus Ishikawaella capsulata]BAH83457.1 twin argininte translocase protein A [Candidatus Ishikawaella capsulata Mpkobe]
MGEIGVGQLLIIAAIIVLLFGSNKLSNLGTDLGTAIRGFKKAINDEETKEDQDKDLKY